METFIYILIGIVSAVFTFSVGYSVIGVVKGNRRQQELEDRIFQLELDLGNINRELTDRIDFAEQRFDTALESSVKELVSQSDSRMDKLYEKIKKQIPPTNDDVMMELRKVREDFLAIRQNL